MEEKENSIFSSSFIRSQKRRTRAILNHRQTDAESTLVQRRVLVGDRSCLDATRTQNSLSSTTTTTTTEKKKKEEKNIHNNGEEELEKKKKKKKKKRSWFCRDTYVITGAMTTRETQQKSQMIGKSDSLWDLIVNNDDITFTHILPRLNSTDVKFLHEVNTETRKLMKRSSRASDLKKRFRTNEMSSISTLEIAWENKSLWPSWLEDETNFCLRVAETNKLELLKWAREEKKCKWDKWTINRAASQGNLEMVQYCVAKKCPGDEYACENAALHGHLEVLKYLHEEVKVPWDSWTADRAADNGHLHILEYLVERKYDDYSEYACGYAAGKGQLDCLKYLHETAKAPWDSRVVFWAQRNNQPECLQYLLDNNCPLPYGWRYEGGVLRTL
jgi:hypothetical protein